MPSTTLPSCAAHWADQIKPPRGLVDHGPSYVSSVSAGSEAALTVTRTSNSNATAPPSRRRNPRCEESPRACSALDGGGRRRYRRATWLRDPRGCIDSQILTVVATGCCGENGQERRRRATHFAPSWRGANRLRPRSRALPSRSGSAARADRALASVPRCVPSPWRRTSSRYRGRDRSVDESLRHLVRRRGGRPRALLGHAGGG